MSPKRLNPEIKLATVSKTACNSLVRQECGTKHSARYKRELVIGCAASHKTELPKLIKERTGHTTDVVNLALYYCQKSYRS